MKIYMLNPPYLPHFVERQDGRTQEGEGRFTKRMLKGPYNAL